MVKDGIRKRTRFGVISGTLLRRRILSFTVYNFRNKRINKFQQPFNKDFFFKDILLLQFSDSDLLCRLDVFKISKYFYTFDSNPKLGSLFN